MLHVLAHLSIAQPQLDVSNQSAPTACTSAQCAVSLLCRRAQPPVQAKPAQHPVQAKAAKHEHGMGCARLEAQHSAHANNVAHRAQRQRVHGGEACRRVCVLPLCLCHCDRVPVGQNTLGWAAGTVMLSTGKRLSQAVSHLRGRQTSGLHSPPDVSAPAFQDRIRSRKQCKNKKLRADIERAHFCHTHGSGTSPAAHRCSEASASGRRSQTRLPWVPGQSGPPPGTRS
jgi:hypothetical protein